MKWKTKFEVASWKVDVIGLRVEDGSRNVLNLDFRFRILDCENR
ncbi:hypothetical protein D1AOALGA4SA_3558 [Olavius algarvensis Delta 1 endosymbiont]|nr:hypothetical protein D1AOALGA4SA_3558 [Olavius algarvensis Delta 1 endosymbiont]